MGVNFLQTSLADFNKEKTLRFDVKFHNVFTKIIKTERTAPFLDFYKVGRKECNVEELDQIKYVEIGSVSNEDNINAFDLSDDKSIDLAERERLLKKIENGDIFKPEEESILIASVRPNLKKYISISNLESDLYFTKAFIYLKPKQDLISSKLLKYVLRTILFNRLIGLCREGKGYPTLKENDLKFFFIENSLIGKIKKYKKQIEEKIDENDQKIYQLKQKIEPLQNIIDDIFVKYGVKSNKFTDKQEEYFLLTSKKIGNNLFLRLGAQYYSFFEVHQGLLFDESIQYNQIPLKQIVKKHRTIVLKKGVLDQPYILLDLEQLEAKTGRILDEPDKVEEIGSDKVVFGDSAIIISKIDPYLAYVFINDKNKNYIGTTELVPFKLVNENTNIYYLKYCLLSNEYITKSALIMYGKRHPRLHIKDLLSIKIPLPDIEIQKKIVSEIQQREEKSNQYKEEIKKLREEIDNLIYKTLKQGEYGFY